MSKINLTDCTFLIPIRIESNDRLRNIITGLCYILANFDTNVIIKEIDSKSVFLEYALPQIKEFVGESLNVNHIFEESSDELFHRMKCLNEMISISKTKVVVNYDCDVLLPKNSYVDSVNTILEYCDLPFEQTCIEFYKNKRAVKTPSAQQVRQPIYTSGLDYWKNYEPYLEELKKYLKY